MEARNGSTDDMNDEPSPAVERATQLLALITSSSDEPTAAERLRTHALNTSASDIACLRELLVGELQPLRVAGVPAVADHVSIALEILAEAITSLRRDEPIDTTFVRVGPDTNLRLALTEIQKWRHVTRYLSPDEFACGRKTVKDPQNEPG